jgi:hypothetical protein
VLFDVVLRESSGRAGVDPERRTPGLMCNFAWGRHRQFATG